MSPRFLMFMWFNIREDSGTDLDLMMSNIPILMIDNNFTWELI